MTRHHPLSLKGLMSDQACMAFRFFVRFSITSYPPSHDHVKQSGVAPCSFDIRVTLAVSPSLLS
jgi:hypothetical protein